MTIAKLITSKHKIPARYHPKLILLVGGLEASHKLNRDIMKEAKSVRR
jgi:hypothetical protein